MNEIAINCQNLGKRYYLNREVQRTVKASMLNIFKRKKMSRDEFWALKNVNFQVAQGETLGVIGSNGAGKSTLLGLLSKTLRPTVGDVSIKGKLSSLLELGAGFHPDLTGRENIFLYASILGLNKKEIEQKVDAIIEFSELHDFIDVPVRFYSSGMYVRLGFAVAVEVDPDVLLIDEVLAVGDETFKKKSMKKILDFKDRGKTLLIVSHDMDTIRAISDRVMVLDSGQLLELGVANDTVDKYIRKGLNRASGELLSQEYGNRLVQINEVRILAGTGQMHNRFQYLGKMIIEMDVESNEEVLDPVFGFSFSDHIGNICFGTNTQIQQFHIKSLKGKLTIQVVIDPLPLFRGKYYLSISSHSSDHQIDYHRKDYLNHFWVDSEKPEDGYIHIPTEWTIKE